MSVHDAGRAHVMIAGIGTEAGSGREAWTWTMTLELERTTCMRHDVHVRVDDVHVRVDDVHVREHDVHEE